MPEGPELHITMLSINKLCSSQTFTGTVVRNPIHKCADIEWDQPAYRISALARGKELMLHLQTVDDGEGSTTPGQPETATSILFTFGMSGKFVYTKAHELFKHSHLTFFSRGEPSMALSFVDPRRFGRWVQEGKWSPDRGPCVIQEYPLFVSNIVSKLDIADFNKPICEVMLNQKLFSGIGNYLRAEILYRCQIPPFVKANSVLRVSDGGKLHETPSQSSECVANGRSRTKVAEHARSSNSTLDILIPQAQELLRLCHVVPLEVVHLGSSKYNLSGLDGEGDAGTFEDWLQCYNKPKMASLADHNKRTIWFSGPAGPMVPIDKKSRKAQSSRTTKKPRKNKAEDVADSSQDLEKTAKKDSDRTLTAEVLTDKSESGRSRRRTNNGNKREIN